MAINNLSFEQCATLLNAINKQATGQTSLTATDTASFISQATATLKTGYDVVNGAISQVLSRTLFSNRPYPRKFKGLYQDSVQWGNHVRKIQVIDQDAQEDARYNLSDGKSVDQQTVKKPQVLQTNFYGANVYERQVTIFKDQLDCAFSGPEEFGRFISMIMQNVSDLMEKDHENLARMALVNFMGAKISKDTDNVFKLVTIYNEQTGAALTSKTVKLPENYVPFMKWAYAFIKTVSDRFTDRSTKYHMNLTGKDISRHTPLAMQKLYLFTDDMNNMETSVLSSVFNDEYLKTLDFEKVNYWQSIDEPQKINVTASYIDATGAVQTAAEVEQGNILGVLFDAEAVGYTIVNQWTAPAPFNAKGGYQNTFWHYTDRYFNDLTENGVVFLME